MDTINRPKYDFKPHVRIKRANDTTSMSRTHHLEVVEREFTDWLKRHKWKAQAKEFQRLCENLKREFPDYESRMNHMEYFINLTIESFSRSISRRFDAT